jgi:RHS repeat-associated protein
MSNASGLTVWAYDARGRVVSEAKQIDSNQFVTGFTYNSADLPVTMTYPVDNEIVTFNYNNAMQLTKVFNDMGTPGSLADDINYAKSIGYDSAGRMTTRVLGENKITSTFNYYAWNAPNGLGRLQSAVHTNTAQTLQTFAYTYDPVGNIAGISDSQTGETQSFGYDALNRLTSASAANGQGNYSESYFYNPTTGNLQTKGSLALQYLDSSHVHAVTSAGNNSYQYDPNGNQTTRVIGSDTFTLFYDAENRLTEVKKNNVTIAQFTFDGDGRRVKSVIGSETILFVGGHYEKQGTNVTKYYFAGAQRIAMRKNGTLSFLLSDHLGSTSITTDANGNRASETRYKAWGETRFTDGIVPTKYSFTGQYSNVADFGLLFYNARWVDPVTGRFIQADSVVPGGVQGLDRYAYVNNSPLRYVDPTGHFNEDEMCIYWGYCGDDAQERAQEELGALYDVMWGTDTTWGDIVFIEDEQGNINTYQFVMSTYNSKQYFGAFLDVKSGKINLLNSFANTKDAVAAHPNDNGGITLIGTKGQSEAIRWLSDHGIVIPDTDDIQLEKGWAMRKYVDLGFWWWLGVAVGTVGFIVAVPGVLTVGLTVAFWIGVGGYAFSIAGWTSQAFNLDFMHGPVDATYPVVQLCGTPVDCILMDGSSPLYWIPPDGYYPQ